MMMFRGFFALGEGSDFVIEVPFPLLIPDEPVSGVYPSTQGLFENIFAKGASGAGWCSRYMDGTVWCDEVALMNCGRPTAQGIQARFRSRLGERPSPAGIFAM